MYQTAIGLALAGVTALGFWWKARHRYRCPFCGRFVQWKDINCPHCGNDMNYRHRGSADSFARGAELLRRDRPRHRSKRHDSPEP